MKNSEQIRDSVLTLYKLSEEKKKFDKYYSDVKTKEQLVISNWMYSNIPKEQNSFDIELNNGYEFYLNPVKLKVTKVRRKKIDWFIDKLKNVLNKEEQKEVIAKTYTINDMEGLVKYLKSCGVEPKKFKKFVDVNEEVIEERLNDLYERGKVDMKSLNGCYKVEMGEPYIRITEQKG